MEKIMDKELLAAGLAAAERLRKYSLGLGLGRVEDNRLNLVYDFDGGKVRFNGSLADDYNTMVRHVQAFAEDAKALEKIIGERLEKYAEYRRTLLAALNGLFCFWGGGAIPPKGK